MKSDCDGNTSDDHNLYLSIIRQSKFAAFLLITILKQFVLTNETVNNIYITSCGSRVGLGILTVSAVDGGHAGTGSGYLSVGSQSVLKMLFGGSLHHRLLLIDFENSANVRKVLVTPYVIPMQIWYILSWYLATHVTHPFTFIALCFSDLSCRINPFTAMMSLEYDQQKCQIGNP